MEYHRLIRELFFSIINNHDTDLNQKIKHLDRPDWDRLVSFVDTSGLLPIFYHQISKLNLAAELGSRFKAKYYRHLKRNLILEQEAWRILEQFRQTDILTVPLKGPVLARLLYNDAGLRQSPCDLDFLIRPQIMERAEKALKNMGYALLEEDSSSLLRFVKLKYGRQLHFAKTSKELGKVNIDLHCDLRGFFSDTFLEYFWQDVREVDIGGHLVHLPTEESLLLYLSLISISTFDFIELRYIYDIHQLIAQFKTRLNWEAVLEKAVRLRLEAYLWFALKLSKGFFNSEIPGEFLNKLKPPFIKRKILSFWIKDDNILLRREKVAASYIWRYLISNCLVTQDLAQILSSIGKKIFLPMAEVEVLYGRPVKKSSYSLYLKRLLKPIYKLLS